MPLLRAFEKLLHTGFYQDFMLLLPAELWLLLDLFHCAMHPPAFTSEAAEDQFPAHDFLAAWLHHHGYLAADQALRPELRLADLGLDVLSYLEMAGDVETYYNVLISSSSLKKWATVADVQSCVEQQLANAAYTPGSF